MVKHQTNKQTKPSGKVLNKTEDNFLFIYTAVAFLENSVFIKTMQKLLCTYV